MNIGTLIATIGGDITPLKGALAKANMELNKFSDNAEKNAAMVKEQFRGLNTISNSLKDFGMKASLAISLPVIAAGGFAIKMASDFNESLNKVDVAFKSSAEEVKEWSKTTLKAFGISQSHALDMAALFGDMSTSMGLTTKEAAKMSMSLVGLAGDMASFKNIGIDQAMTALNGIFTGETESLKRLGIVMTEANLSAFALSQGIRTNYQDMAQAEKVQLRYNYVMSVTKNSQGDFARTQGGAANQMRIFKESLNELGVAFGQVVLPAFTKIITAINGVLQGLKSLNPMTQKIIILIAGVAAAIGPLSLGISGILSMVPSMISAGTAIAAAWAPLTLIILGIAGAIALYNNNLGKTLVMTGKISSLTDAQLQSQIDMMNKWRDSPKSGKRDFWGTYESDTKLREQLGLPKDWNKSDSRILMDYWEELQKAQKARQDALEEQITADILQSQLAKSEGTAPSKYTGKMDPQDWSPEKAPVMRESQYFKIKEHYFTPLIESIKPLQDSLKSFSEVWQEAFGDNVTLHTITNFDKLGKKINEIKLVMVDWGAELQKLTTDALVGFAEGFGNALTTGDWKGIFDNFLIMVADWAINLGSLMMAAAVAASAFWKSLMTPTGWPLALALGGALVVAGAAVKGAMSAPGTSSTSSSGVNSSSGSSGVDLTRNRQLQEFLVNVTGEVLVDGQKLRIVLNNEDRRRGA